MPGAFDPFSPGAIDDPTAAVDPNSYSQIRQQWDSFLGQPGGRAALLSAGLALMQPQGFGDNPTAQIGRAIGAAGQSVGQVEGMDLKKAEQESKSELRSAQATAAEARADAAGARAGAAGSALEFRREKLASDTERAKDQLDFRKEGLKALGERESERALFRREQDANRQQRSLTQARLRASIAYQQYLKDVNAKNSNPLNSGPKETPLGMNEWIGQNPMIRDLLTASGAGGGSTPQDAADDAEADAAGVPASSPSTTSGGASSGPPPAPTNAAERSVNTVYTTPRGPLRWLGDGKWAKP